MIKAITYQRFSPRPNADECESNVYQERLNREYCERMGYRVVCTKGDADASGDDFERPGLWSAIEQLKRGMVLVVHKGDRLARSLYFDLHLRHIVEKRGARIEVVDSNHNSNSLEDELMRNVLASFFDYQKKANAARTRAASLNYQANGRAMSKIPPYGKRPGPAVQVTDRNGELRARRTWLDDADEQRVIQQVVAERTAGATLRAIAAGLNAGGELCRGKPFNKTIIASICRRAGIEKPPVEASCHAGG